MNEQFYTILTKLGKAKIANAISLGKEVNLVSLQVGDSNGAYYNPTEEQTELRNKVWETRAISVIDDANNPNYIKIEAIIPGDVGGFTVREIGVFDDKGDMIAVGKIAEIYKPVSENGSTKDVLIRIILEVSNASSVTIKVDPTVMIASKKDLEDLESKIKKTTGDKNNLTTKDKSNLVNAINEVATGLSTIELTAEKVTTKDTDNNFTSETVEGALQELADKDNTLETDLNKKLDTLEADLKQSVSSGKQLIATATTGKGVPTNGSDSFQIMADNIDSIKTKLPIQDGDAGVAEDLEGNVYGVEKIEERHIYLNELNKTTKRWQYSVNGNNNMVASGLQGSVYVKTSNKIIYVSSSGEEIWNYSSSPSRITSDLQGNAYAISGTKLIKLSPSGELIWEKTIGSSIYSISSDLEGNVYIGSFSRILKLSPLGDEIWENPLVGNATSCIKLGIDSQGNVYVGSSSKIVKLSSLGEEIWERTLGTSARSVSVDQQGNVYVVTASERGKVIKMSPSGELIWEYYVISEDSVLIRINDIATDRLGYSYITTYHYNLSTGGEIINLSPSGETIWKFGYGGYAGASISLDSERNIHAYCYNSGNSSYYGRVIALKDNYTIEKIAVLKER